MSKKKMCEHARIVGWKKGAICSLGCYITRFHCPSNTNSKCEIVAKPKYKTIILVTGEECIVDNEDYPILSRYTWHLGAGEGGRKYVQAQICGHPISIHRLLMAASPYRIVDHIDNNPLNNSKSNLRFCSHNQSLMNRRKKKNATSKYKGVYFHKRSNKYIARIHINGVKKDIGSFKSEIQAAHRYNEAAIQYYGEFARLNDIKGDK